jgi:hypothetical protein
MKYGTTARDRAKSIVWALDEYLRAREKPFTPWSAETTRAFLVLAFEIALEEAGTDSMAISLLKMGNQRRSDHGRGCVPTIRGCYGWRIGIGMMGPQPGSPFADRNSPQRPKQWWEQPMPTGRQQPDDNNRPANQPIRQISRRACSTLMMGLSRMSRPQYDKAIQGGGAGGISPGAAAQVSPWAFLGSMGLPGGAGWGGGSGNLLSNPNLYT